MSQNPFKIEACVESLKEAIAAENAGAHQIELCSRLDLDGLFPGRELIMKTQSALTIPIKVMIRARPGNFEYLIPEMQIMFEQIDICRAAGIGEIVLGATLNGRLDKSKIIELSKAANPMKVTVHKAIDVTTDPLAELDGLMKIEGISGVLSSGGQRTAWEGRENLRAMIEKSQNRLIIIPAGRILPDNLPRLHSFLGAAIYHGRKILGPLSSTQ